MTTKEQKIQQFNPSEPGSADGTIFGLPFTAEESEFIIVPAPWEVTVSYGAGASKGPEAILNASFQVDLLHQQYPDLWKLGIYYDNNIPQWKKQSKKYKKKAQKIIEALENGKDIATNKKLTALLEKINTANAVFHQEVQQRVEYWMQQGKKVILLGGDHSTPLGYYQALAKQHTNFGILHLDAHMDLRIAYEGFTHSHASIMYNAMQMNEISTIVQVGIRDFSTGEVEVIKSSDKIKVYTDTDLKTQQFEGKTWKQQCDVILAQLPEKVAVSFDIDALQRWYCPDTGTPVPGGLSYEQVAYLLDQLAQSNKEIIGIDLVEVAPGKDEWNGNVGARMLYHICGAFAKNHKMPVGEKIMF